MIIVIKLLDLEMIILMETHQPQKVKQHVFSHIGVFASHLVHMQLNCNRAF